ncbi:MAG: hypothetical protein K8T26_09670 [Lentisphaerae bacterium]|nr:hypothetical protein [Lentisphaerota bacterium]
MPTDPAEPGRRLRPRPLLPAATALLLLIAVTTHARVFSRWNSRGDTAATFAALGGHLIFESRITLNGGSGDLQVFDLDRALTDLTPDLRRLMAADALGDGAGGLACATLQDDAQVLRLVLTQPDPFGHTVAFVLRQSPAEFARSSDTASVPSPAGLPRHPGATPRFYAEDQNTKTRFSLADAATPADDLRAYYAGQLAGSGWQPLTPPPGPGVASTGLQVFAKGEELCFVLVAESPATGGATITLLHKRLGMK